MENKNLKSKRLITFFIAVIFIIASCFFCMNSNNAVSANAEETRATPNMTITMDVGDVRSLSNPYSASGASFYAYTWYITYGSGVVTETHSGSSATITALKDGVAQVTTYLDASYRVTNYGSVWNIATKKWETYTYTTYRSSSYTYVYEIIVGDGGDTGSSSGSSGSGSSSSDGKMTESEWKDIFSVDKYLNVTIRNAGWVGYSSDKETLEASYALVMQTALTYNGSYYSGNTYMCDIYGGSGYVTGSYLYESLTADSYSYVYKEIDSKTDDEWDGGYYDSCNTDGGKVYVYIYDRLLELLSAVYNEVEYSGGYYIYEDEDGNTYTMTITDGYLTYMVVASSYEYNGETYTTTYKYTFSDYGTTEVEIPEGYTYDYYAENYADDSGKLAESEWEEVYSYDKFLNVSVSATGTASVTSEGETMQLSYAFTAQTALIDNGNYYSGNTYMYELYGASGYLIKAYMYESLASDSYSYVSRMTETDADDEWDGGYYDNCNTLGGEVYEYIYEELIETVAEAYEEIEYSNGVYIYSDGYGTTYTVTITDGYLTKLILESSFTDGGDSYTVSYTYYFSDYGTTEVEIPEEYTYSSYAAVSSGSTEDSSGSTDTGSGENTDGSTDAGNTEDTGGSTDTGSTEDTGGSTDTGSTEDSSGSSDTGSAEDSSGSTESESTEDTGGSTNAGSAEDSSGSTESESTEDT
ncbi:MAG: hypothetical protein LUF82_03655, partial [Clostridia bacterium]|nr:hypothetical protein [Clostridia bacterium]